MRLIEKYTYSFDDVSLEPAVQSHVFSRRDVRTSVKFSKDITLDTPIIASPMADVCNDKVAIAMHKAGAIGCIHRFQTIEEEAEMVKNVRAADARCFAAVGTSPDFMQRTAQCVDAGACGIIVDVAFLNQRTLDACAKIRQVYPYIYLISGNVATGAGFRMGAEAGLDAIRVGIGNGQACRTSRVTGVGVGLVTSIMECAEEHQQLLANQNRDVKVICDGGMDVGGSFCKALAAGAHGAIMGRAFAATVEGPGRMVTEQGIPWWEPAYIEDRILHKEYRGSASMEAQLVYKDRGDIITSEGVASLVKVCGSVADVVARYNGALRSSMSYMGSSTIEQFQSDAVFRLVSQGTFSQTKARSLQSYEVTI